MYQPTTFLAAKRAGASIGFYFLAGQTTEQVTPSTRLKTLAKAAAVGKAGMLTGTFTVELPSSVRDPTFASYIYAVGPLNSDGSFGVSALGDWSSRSESVHISVPIVVTWSASVGVHQRVIKLS